MPVDAEDLQNDQFSEIGQILVAESERIIDEWCQRTVDSHLELDGSYRQQLRNALPEFLRSLGAALKVGDYHLEQRRRERASEHGEQRWRAGWRLSDVVADYQLLRLTLLEYLDTRLPRPLTLREVIAVGLLLDDAIGTAVVTYVDFQDSNLAESEERSRGTFENAAVGIAHVGPDATWIRVNQRLCDTVARTRDELMTSTLIELTIPEDRSDIQDRLAEMAAGSSNSFTQELRLSHRNGGAIWVQLTGSASYGSDGKVQYFILIIDDISLRKRLDNDLHQLRETAERANLAKSQFVANVSHEIRTPMTAILGLTELALDEPLSPTLHDFVATVHDSAKSLLNLLNDILDFSKIEAGKLELECSPFNLHQVVEDTVQQHGVRASAKGLELMTDIDEAVPRFVRGDALRLRQVLANLTSNAVKFTDRGEVIVRMALESLGNDTIVVRGTVKDTGIGITDADQEKVFAPFTQVDSSITRGFGGSGLGLAIATELVHRMHGRLWVTSEIGAGSEFCFTAQFEIEAEPETTKEWRRAAVADLSGSSVLVVDDNATNRTILSRILRQWSVRVETVDGGESAMQRLSRTKHGDQPMAIVLLDALMPGIDGFSIAERIKSDPEIDTRIVLMLSAADRLAFLERLNRIELSGLVDKPISQIELLEALVNAATRREHASHVHSLVSEPLPSRPLSILVVEDVPANQKVVRAMLAKRGHHVMIANNGRDAIDKIQRDPFDVVLMDVQLPTMDGYQATALIRKMEDPSRAAVPVIAMTANAMQGDAEKCLAAGMDAFIPKPVESRRLIDMVENIHDSRTMLNPAAESGRCGDSTVHGESPSWDSDSAIINLQAALVRLGGDRTLLQDLITFFEADAPQLLNAIATAIDSCDAEAARRASHSLKGLAAHFDAGLCVAAAKRVEVAAIDQDWTACRASHGTLCGEVERLLVRLRAF